MVTREYAEQLLKKMVSIPSLSGHEQELGLFLVEEMGQLGFEAQLDEQGNLIAEREYGDGPLIVLLGHMDTVPEFRPVYESGAVLYGRGTVDAKGPLATFICAAASLARMPGRLVIVGAVEEETAGSRGARALRGRYEPDAVIIGEPSGHTNVVIGYKGRIGAEYRVTRPAGHSAGPGESAAEVAVRFWNMMALHLEAGSDGNSVFNRPVPALNQFVATREAAELSFACRTPIGFSAEDFLHFMQESRDDGSLTVHEIVPACLHSRSAPPARAIVQAIRRQGLSPGVKVKTGTCDMNTVSEFWTAPMAAYGPGDSLLDHTDDEHIELSEYWSAIGILSEALPILAGELAGRSAGRDPTTMTKEMQDPERGEGSQSAN